MIGNKISVALIEDSREYLAGLSGYLSTLEDIAVCGMFNSAKEARLGLGDCRPDVILLDVGMPGETGLELLPELSILAPGAEVLILTTFDDTNTISTAVHIGASGFVLKRNGLTEIVAAIRKVHAGGAALSDSVARELMQLFRKRARTASLLPALSPQENRLLQLLSDGLSLKQAAGVAGITYETSRRYMSSVYRKLKVSSMSQALGYYLRGGQASV